MQCQPLWNCPLHQSVLIEKHWVWTTPQRKLKLCKLSAFNLMTDQETILNQWQLKESGVCFNIKSLESIRVSDSGFIMVQGLDEGFRIKRISILKIRQSHKRLISTIGISQTGKIVFTWEGLWSLQLSNLIRLKHEWIPSMVWQEMCRNLTTETNGWMSEWITRRGQSYVHHLNPPPPPQARDNK